MNRAIICETHEQAQEEARTRGWRVKAVYIVPAEEFVDVRNELLLKRKLEDIGMGGETAGRAVGVLLGWLRQRAGITKWLAYATP